MDEEKIEKLLDELDKRCPRNTLQYFLPSQRDEPLFYEICSYYLSSSPEEKDYICSKLKELDGLTNSLLGYAFQCIKYLKKTKDEKWLKIGVCAATLAELKQDYRDVLMHLAELYVTAEELNLNPDPVFKEMKLKNFKESAIVRERRAGIWKLLGE
jgi:hypothetical protein